MKIGITFDLRSDYAHLDVGPEDRLEEYDSDTTVDAIAQALAELGHTPVRLGGGRAFLQAVLTSPPDLVFNFAEGYGTRSREAHVPSVLEMLGIPFTQCDPLTAALTLDTPLAKRVVASFGIPTARFAVIDDAAHLDAALELAFPVIAKPAFEGSSMGIRRSSRCVDPDALRELVLALHAGYAQPVLVEEFLPGAEFTVGVLGTGPTARCIGAMEIVPKRAPIASFVYSLEAKRDYQNEVSYHAPPRRPAGLVEAVERVALDAYRALGCREVGRVDVRLDAQDRPCFIEVNPLPGLNPVTGDLVLLAAGCGMDYRELIGAIVTGACHRAGLPIGEKGRAL